jgi:hypothetical protein
MIEPNVTPRSHEERAQPEPGAGGWIETVERCPSDHQHVLAWITGGSLHHDEDYMDIAMYLHGIFRHCNGEEDEPVPVSHWMPLPQPPGRA